MTYSNRGNDRSRSTFYGKPSFEDRGSNRSFGDRPAMHDATCAKCGSACQVPFVPNGRKEVFCSRCFSEMNGGERDSRNSQRFERNDSRKPKMYDRRDGGSSISDRHMFDAVCDECGKNCQIPFEPRNGKPVLCSNCFAKTKEGNFSTPRNDSYSKPAVNSSELEAINKKLDKIIKLLTPPEIIEKKQLTEKIVEEIKVGLEKTASPEKKTKKAVSKKKAK